MHSAGDVRVEEREDPKIIDPRTRSSGWRRPASAGRTCGPTAGSSRRITRWWGTSTSASSKRSATRWRTSRSV